MPVRRIEILIASNRKRIFVKWRVCSIGCRMWRRGLIAEKQPRDQTPRCYAAREISAASIESAELGEISVRRNVAITTENATGTLPEIGNDHDIRLVVTGAGFDPCFPLAHFIGRSHVGVSVS